MNMVKHAEKPMDEIILTFVKMRCDEGAMVRCVERWEDDEQ